MRILGVFPSYEPAWAFGGIVRCTSNLFRALAAGGADVSVYTTNADGRNGFLPVDIGTPSPVNGVSVTYFRSTLGPRSVWDSRELTSSLREAISDFDIVYVSANWQWIGLSVAKIARKQRVPYIIGAHGSFMQETFQEGRLKKRIYWNLFLKRCIEGAHALHFTTEHEKRSSSWLLSDRPAFVVPNCLSLDESVPESGGYQGGRAEYGIPVERPLVLTVVRPDPVKRLDVILEALAEVTHAVPDMGLVIVGDCENDYGRRMKDLARSLGVLEHTFWVGHRTGEQLWTWYRECDIFVLISDHENFSMVAAEAMSAGLPVIVSDTVGLSDHVLEFGAGCVCEVDSRGAARSIAETLRDRRKLQEMGQAAKETACRLYAPEETAHRMLSEFNQIIGSREAESPRASTGTHAQYG